MTRSTGIATIPAFAVCVQSIAELCQFYLPHRSGTWVGLCPRQREPKGSDAPVFQGPAASARR